MDKMSCQKEYELLLNVEHFARELQSARIARGRSAEAEDNLFDALAALDDFRRAEEKGA